MHRARFSADLVGTDLIVVVDLNGGRSVTNDIENVVRTIADYTSELPQRRIIYRDSSGVWDGVVVSERGEFRRFISIGTKDMGAAIAIARGNMPWT